MNPGLDENLVFLISRGDLRGRLDAYFNWAIKNNRLRSQFKTESLYKLLVHTFSGGTPSKSNASYWEGRIPWASPKDFGPFYLTDTEDHISEEALSSTKLAPSKAVLVVVRSGILHHTLPVAVTQRPVAINQDLKALIPSDRIIPEYLAIYFNVFQDALLPLTVKHSTTVQSINTEQFSALRIPVPPVKVQKEIIAIILGGLDQSHQKQTQAADLLASIDDYLLQALNITLPPTRPNTVQQRMFCTSFNQTVGRRLDPFYYQSKYQDLYEAIEQSQFQRESLRDVITDLKNGVEIRKYTTGKGKRYLRVTDLTNRGLSDRDVKYVDVKEVPAKIKLAKSDFLISRSGSLGLVNIVTDEILDVVLSSHIFRVRLNTTKILPQYLQAYFRSHLGQFQFFQRNNGGVIPEISQDALKTIVIVIPPFHIQKAIADHIRATRQQSADLEREAQAILARAKAQIEQMIIGESA